MLTDSCKKKILIIQHFTGIGGSTLSCFDIIRSLDKNLYEVLLLIPAGDSDAKKMSDQSGIQVIESSIPIINFTYHNASSGVIRSLLKLLLSQRYGKQWKELLRKINPDLVILNSSIQAPMIPLIKQCGVPCICFVRETMRGKSITLANRFMIRFLNRGDGITFLTDYDRKCWSVSEKIPQKVIPDIVDSTFFLNSADEYEAFIHSNKINTSEFNVVYFGGFSYIKGVHNIVQAISFLSDLKVNLYILGEDGSNIRNMHGIKKLIYLREVLCIRATDKKIKLINSVNRKIHTCGKQMEPINWYRIADVIVFPVQKVHQARPVYEAGYYSKPAIVPDFDNFQDNIIHGFNGLVYGKTRIESLAECIRELYDHPEYKEKLGLNNKEMTEKKHNEKLLSNELNHMVIQILRKQ